MELARLEVRPKAGADRRRIEDQAAGYVGCLIRQGQVLGRELWTWVDDFHCYVRLAGHDALERGFHSDQALEERRKLEALGEVRWERIGETGGPVVYWQDAEALYLTPSKIAPVRTLPEGEAVRVYTLPLRPLELDDLVQWGRRADLFDDLWLDSGVLELAAYAELASPKSYLSVGGRELAEAVEKRTGKPTYYWLMRAYTADAEGEATRPCPGCGRPLESSPFGGDDYMSLRCEACRLLTGVGGGEGEEEAKIGAWDPTNQREYPSNATRWLDTD